MTSGSLTSSSSKVNFKGVGVVNGATGYSFLITGIDGAYSSGKTDNFRIKIWNTSTNAVVYDNQSGAADNADATQVIGGGQILSTSASALRVLADSAPGFGNPDQIRYRVFPNPFDELITLQHETVSDQPLELLLMDVQGKVLKRMSYGIQLDAMYTMPLNELELSPGLYLLRVVQGEEWNVVKVVKR